MSDQSDVARLMAQLRAQMEQIADRRASRKSGVAAGGPYGSVFVDAAGHVYQAGGGTALAAYVYRDTVQAVSNSLTPSRIQWDTNYAYDPAGAITSGASWNYAIPAAGIYRAEAQLQVSTGGAWSGGTAVLRLHMTTCVGPQTSMAATWQVPLTNGVFNLYCLFVGEMTAGGQIYATFTQNGGVGCNITGHMAIYR